MATAAQIGITGIDASYYTTKDLNAATKWYTSFFGFEPTMHVPETVSEWTLGDEGTFGLYQPQDKNDWRPGGGILFHVDDLDRAVEAAKALGAKFDEHAEDTPVCRMAFGSDPEGNNFIIHQPKDQ
jgi:predicted enzyme related to lactoylglutathione lyase